LGVSGSHVYTGGGFSSVNGVARRALAAIDIATGTVTPWNPNVNGTVTQIVLSGSTLYAAGLFAGTFGEGRGLISLDFPTGTVSSTWFVRTNNYVRSFVLLTSTILIG